MRGGDRAFAKKEGRSRDRRPVESEETKRRYRKDEWMQFLQPNKMKLRGEEPDFSEEGWARRKPKKKK